ncbi:hypothetical protein BG011_003273 [Mortierella polycephala]|uniref:Eisosome component PIL1-domain-containing protein n=1 Tax=Mortierella polycephala TaxID=41804 RepID=A0A9P6Q1E7_9FUNG|nr:hypothetical protein BG011_003273 [Mortierella polycephala]
MQSIGHDLRRGLNNFSLSNNYKHINKWLAELKNIDSSLKTLDKEITTNAKLISAWGCDEGDDLTDVCQRMTQEVGLIHQQYSLQHTAYRKMIKTLKTQELTLDDNRKKKHDLTNQIAKQQKSSKENPIKMMELQSALERVSADLLAQELGLLQFKRATIQDAFNLQFDSMIEFAEKMALIAGYGRQITNVIDVGPQEAEKTTLYNGAEYTAAAINQVKISVTSWQAQPVGNPIRTYTGPTQDELALSVAAATYSNRPPSRMDQQYAMSYSPTGSQLNDQVYTNGETVNKNSGQWDDVQMLTLDKSQTSLHDHHQDSSEYENWKQEIHGVSEPSATDPSDDYLSPPGSNQLQEQQQQLQLEQQRAFRQNLSSYSPASSPSQQHYRNAAANVANGLRHSSAESYGIGGMAGSGSTGGRPFTPTTQRRNDTMDLHPPSSYASPSPTYSSFQQQPASYEDSVSPAPARGFRYGFANRKERMDNSDLYKSEIGTAPSRYPKTAVIMDEK